MKKVIKRQWLLLLLCILSLTIAACGTKENEPNNQGGDKAANEEVDNRPVKDRAGNEISIPDTTEKIISMAPSTTQILDDLGLKDKLIGVDNTSPAYTQLESEIPQFDMMAPDLEQILALEPDIVFTSTMSHAGGEDIFLPLRQAGICVVEIPTSNTIEDIKTDIQFVGDSVGKSEEAVTIIKKMEQEIEKIAEIGKTIEDKKTVLFEISAAPYIYSFGKGVFLNEMLEIVGAVNILGEEESWLPVTEEVVVSLNPDVILTNVNYIEDSVGEVKGRESFKEVAALINGDVYYIDNGASSLPNQNIVIALREMAKAVYPEAYAALAE